jgi:hypothetical protein
VSTTLLVAGPRVVDDYFSVKREKSAKLAVLANDLGSGDAPLVVSSLRIVSGPSHAAHAATHDTWLDYAPLKGYRGMDTIQYSICSSTGACATGLVTITVTD